MQRGTAWLRAVSLAALVGATFGGLAPEDPADANGEVLWISGERRAAFEPTAAFDAQGRLWVVWVSSARAMRDSSTAGHIDGACLVDGAVVAEISFEDAGPLPAAPEVVAFADGVYCVWEAGPGGARELLGRALTWKDGAPSAGPLERVPSGPGTPLAPSLASTAGSLASTTGSLALAFQGLAGTDYDVFLARREGGIWSDAVPLTDTPLDEWNPRLAAGPDGALHAVWDVFDGASFDVVHARLAADGSRRDVRVASSADYEGAPELSVADDGSAWIAFERAAQFGEAGGLRDDRDLGLARVADDGVTWLAPGQLSRRVRRRDLPRPLATPEGLLLAHRLPVRGERKRDHLFTAWMTSVSRFDDGREAEWTVPGSDGDAHGRMAFVRGPDGPWLVFAADGRRSSFNEVEKWSDPIEQRTRIGLVRLAPPSGFPAMTEAPPPALRERASATTKRAKDGPLWGDLHRHTSLSRCGGAKDGTLLDTWRYARGPGALDFVAVTDHYQHLRSWSFWRTIRDCERYDAPGSLVVFAGIERVRAARGHYNDIYLDPSNVRWDPDEWDLPPARHAPAPADEVIAIPHMMSVDDGTAFDWNEFDEDRTRLFEVYQGKRGNYEGSGMPYETGDGVEPETALARGFERGAHFGLVAASDHVSTSTSFAGVHASARTRAAVFEALRERRVLAATTARGLDARLGALAMGESGTVAPGAVFTVDLGERAASDVAYVELVQDGVTAARLGGGAASSEVWILTLRRGFVVPTGGLRVEVDGGRITGAHVRRDAAGRLDSTGATSVVFARTDYVQCDLALTVEWEPGERHSFVFPGEPQVRVPRAEVAVGRSQTVDEPSYAALLWRQGAPLGAVAGPIVFEVDTRPEHSYYARVAWTDGNLAWTSPIRIRAASEERGQ